MLLSAVDAPLLVPHDQILILFLRLLPFYFCAVFRSFEARAVDTFDITAGASLAAAILGAPTAADAATISTTAEKDASTSMKSTGSPERANSINNNGNNPITQESVSYSSLANAIKKFPAILAAGKAAAKLRNMVRIELTDDFDIYLSNMQRSF